MIKTVQEWREVFGRSMYDGSTLETKVDRVLMDVVGYSAVNKHRKGGTDPDFNSAAVELTREDLDRLEEDVRSNRLPKTSGFFFGESNGDDKYKDLAFITKARVAIAEGFCVFYSSWW